MVLNRAAAAPGNTLVTLALPALMRVLHAGKLLVLLVLLALGLALVGQILSAPLRHDEQMFASMGLLYRQGDIYRDFGFNHLPNLPIMLDALVRIFDPARPVLAFRWVIVAGWLATVALVAAISWRATSDAMLTGLCCLLLLANPVLGAQAGTLVTNNFLPIPFALAGLGLYIGEVERWRIRPLVIALAGLLLAMSVGMKANYVLLVPPFAVAALLAPPALTLRHRIVRVGLPLLAGGIVGAVPTLLALHADPAGFIDHVMGYHRGPHLAWALAQPEPLVISLRDRFVLALSLWGSSSSLLLALALVATTAQLWLRGWRPNWPVLLVAGLVLMGIAVSFIPRPSFPQYFVPPLPFAIVLLALLFGALAPAERRAAMPMAVGVALLTLLIDGPRLVTGLPALLKPGQWAGNQVHAIAVQVAGAAHGRRVATLSPLYVLDGGGQVYDELAVGPFVYRVADMMKPSERRYWRLVSPKTLAARLDAEPPGAILVGAEGHLDDAFRTYARGHGYAEAPLVGGMTRYGALQLYVPTSASISLPPPIRAATSSAPSPSIR